MVKVKIGLNGTTIWCESYKWGDNGIVLYNVEHDGSFWGQVEIFNNCNTITVFKDETKPVEEPEEIPW